jgi:hypothetical protein
MTQNQEKQRQEKEKKDKERLERRDVKAGRQTKRKETATERAMIDWRERVKERRMSEGRIEKREEVSEREKVETDRQTDRQTDKARANSINPGKPRPALKRLSSVRIDLEVAQP